MHKALYPDGDIDTLSVSRKEGGIELNRIHDSVDASIKRLEDYIKKCGERLITATRNNTYNTSINRTKITRKQKFEEKHIYGHYKRWTGEISNEETWTLLKKGSL